MVKESLTLLINYIEKESFKGYDPYDILNAPIDFLKFGKYSAAVLTQIQKRNPVNIRPLLGIRKEYNPKGLGLMLKAYCLLYNKTGNKKYLEKAGLLFNWLSYNYSEGYSGKCWGYNFDWASPGNYIESFTPSVVVTSFVVDGIFQYYKTVKNPKAREIILSSSLYVKNDIPITQFAEGLSFSYSHLSKGSCYNASLLASEILAKADFVNDSSENAESINQAIDFVLSRQKPGGEWAYSFDPGTGKERFQIDFHQGFILVSLEELNNLLENPRKDVDEAIKKGLFYYRNKQFLETGRSLWRIPKKWPVDIHNQSQGIITFSRLKKYEADYLSFSRKIASWTVLNMQSDKGYFYYRKNRFFTNRIPYMRWSQAWMMLALAELIFND